MEGKQRGICRGDVKMRLGRNPEGAGDVEVDVDGLHA